MPQVDNATPRTPCFLAPTLAYRIRNNEISHPSFLASNSTFHTYSLTYLHASTLDLGYARRGHRVQLETEARSTSSDLNNRTGIEKTDEGKDKLSKKRREG